MKRKRVGDPVNDDDNNNQKADLCEVCLYLQKLCNRIKEPNGNDRQNEIKILNVGTNTNVSASRSIQKDGGPDDNDFAVDLQKFSIVKKAKYRCPKCKIRYCSLECFKLHKDDKVSLCKPVESKSQKSLNRQETMNAKEASPIPEKIEDVGSHNNIQRQETRAYSIDVSNLPTEKQEEIPLDVLNTDNKFSVDQSSLTTSKKKMKVDSRYSNKSPIKFPLPMVIADVEEEGPSLTAEMKDILLKSEYIQLEIRKDPTLLSLLKDISNAPPEKKVHTLLKAKNDFPKFNIFMDKMLEEIGVLQDGTFASTNSLLSEKKNLQL